jgi:hypothetical protein
MFLYVFILFLKILIDARLGRLSLLPNLLRYFGWQPMNTLYDFIGQLVETKLGDKDATFKDVSFIPD